MKAIDFAHMSDDALMRFWSKYHRPTPADAVALIGNRRPGFTDLAHDLANLASNLHAKRLQDQLGLGPDTYGFIIRRLYTELPDDIRSYVYLPATIIKPKPTKRPTTTAKRSKR